MSEHRRVTAPGLPEAQATWPQAVASAANRLEAAGVHSPRNDAELLAAHVSGLTRTRLLIADGPTAAQLAQFNALIERRATREPLQHLTGSAAFRYGELAVGPGVFVPRPETELLVDWALEHLPQGGTVIDACSGSGAIAYAIATERPDATVWAIEADPDAFEWLESNLDGTGATPVLADATAAATLNELDGAVDLVTANPPYVPFEMEVAPEVKFDPHGAVYAAEAGLAVIQPLAVRAAGWLKPGGWFGFEHDDTHGAVAPEILGVSGFTETEDHDDLAGRPRFATGRLGLSP
ncbi:peptide chain release factor N(5)-glutamine methyltransferase [Glycomyces algeriensis]|uniref:Release factor glutamine methyltransferase n=1 Tax=Glycomyces algeriensis TaxID=256037 RepID=A0A9W6LIZ0_9ACTN|nr:peptide chain release factor N(5)-glutamine methyltransferase [Glycomyces algeriensis]MDA1366517.1 peptide chain release factor N(5)-glutamine methyltransferase [Glycomyces algeriensis]MDR7352175.1 release factor glutamine methyltransferase [Glycomyces algeriensis]GLI44910.1 release factor glutamine methyltransferase [Glycomyces algeriensis]